MVGTRTINKVFLGFKQLTTNTIQPRVGLFVNETIAIDNFPEFLGALYVPFFGCPDKIIVGYIPLVRLIFISGRHLIDKLLHFFAMFFSSLENFLSVFVSAG